LVEGADRWYYSRLVQWGTEHLFKVYYGDLPKFSAVSGYTGGHATNPSK
jgi:peptide-methionine (S)-S-oxide reductase